MESRRASIIHDRATEELNKALGSDFALWYRSRMGQAPGWEEAYETQLRSRFYEAYDKGIGVLVYLYGEDEPIKVDSSLRLSVVDDVVTISHLGNVTSELHFSNITGIATCYTK